ncbi:glycosyltransferase family 4 protein [Pluralibacter gergoviae]|nr:glycosyltransferase family 4 protein [Pluralibacter gergoviae]ELC3016783.1 glycosyltransferase family 4 protein [Pluralibacter gergoviae]ELC3022302.1 glycosyltransferase family 4 protein [Pluralibacter gergoviae]
MNKKIFFDANWVGPTGIGRFSSEIINRIPFLNIIPIKGNPLSFIYMIKLSIFLFFNKGIYFTPGFNVPLFKRKKTIITIHDLNHVDINDNSSVFKRIYYRLFLKTTCKSCLLIFTVSEFSRKRIIEWSGVDSEKVVVIGNGVSKEFSEREVRNSEIIKDKYILMVSNRKTHKNEIRALTAFSQAGIDDNIKLFITGDENSEVKENIIKLGIQSKVRFLGYTEDSDLARYYRESLALLFPSLYEGFGLPVIEAMTSAVPVITSKTTSLGEIAGDAALLVDPLEIDEIKEAIVNVITDDELRQRLIASGLIRARLYNWDDVAKRIINSIS